MFTSNPDEIPTSSGFRTALEVQIAMQTGSFQIAQPRFCAPGLYILLPDGTIIVAYPTSGNGNEYAVPVDSFNYLLVTPPGTGRLTDLPERLDRYEFAALERRQAALEDPEGAWGGRGNNIISGL